MKLPVHRLPLLIGIALLFTGSANADTVTFHGKVTMADGSPPGRIVSIQRTCAGLDHPIREASVSPKTGEYWVRLQVDDFGHVVAGVGYTSLPCVLEAVASGLASTQLDLMDRGVVRSGVLPTIVLTPETNTVKLSLNDAAVPHAASAFWNSAIKELGARNWPAAETSLRNVVEKAPKFAPAWSVLGTVCENQGKSEHARKALQRAIELDPKPLPPYVALADAQIELKDWEGAAATSRALIAADTKNQYVEAHLQNAVARYQLKDYDGALASINNAIRLDKRAELPRAEYVLALVLEARQEFEGAAQHFRNYAQQHPRAKDAAAATARIANLGKTPPADLSVELAPADLRLAAAGEAAVPGGIKAFSTLAHLKGAPSYQDFFLEYCRAITENGPTGTNATKESGEAVRAFIASVSALETIGERRADSTLIRLSLANEEQRRRSQIILDLLGWKLIAKGDSFSVEPGEQDNQGHRQWVLAALGIDQLGMQQALVEKGNFEFEIPRENARLVGGAAWGVILKGVPEAVGGPIAVFMGDWRFARVYRGLGAMEGDTAATLVSAIGLANLIVKYSPLVADFGEALAVANQHVEVPGGVKAQPVWARLAGANPQSPAPFLRALFEKDQGRLLAFYFDLARADAPHQQYFTQSPERAEAFYKWYRESTGPVLAATRWQADVLHKLPLDAAGKVAFPGGREAWSTGAPHQEALESDDDVLLRHAPLEALAALTVLEEKRAAPLSPAAVQLLAQHFEEWRRLFPYFEKLPGLDAAEFHALADFAAEVAKAPASRRNVLMGEWHSLVKLMVLGTEAGSLNATQGARAFRQVCEGLRSGSPSAKAIEALRDMAGDGPDVDEALASHLLRLGGSRREAFEKVKTLQNVPRLGALTDPPDAAKTLAALSGAVYAALLDPACLLVAEDPLLLSRHNFVPGPGLFAPPSLVISNVPPGSNFAGGFGSFQEVASALNQRTVGELQAATEIDAAGIHADAAPAAWPGGPLAAAPAANDLIFRAGGRIVEVYATVTDSRGRYVDDLAAGQFAILEDGRQKPVFAFENHTSGVSVALVFDTTGSMATALAPLKNAALQLVEELRPTDSVAVYSFNDTVHELQSFTTDKAAAKRAILKTSASGITALYDALVRVNHDLSARAGKKVIIVFTDGSDNASTLPANIAIERAKARGIPIYTIAEGEALIHPELIRQLSNISQSTGGTPFLIRKLSDIGGVFEKVSQDLMHGYLLAVQTAPGANREWRKIEVVLSGPKGRHVRAREGYYAE
jgi:Ca-activated chloride channel family protein